MFDPTTFIAYLAASVAIILAPAQALTIARSIVGGKKSGVMTALGLNVGTVIHTFAAALGLSAILATSALAFAAVKYLGAAYLIYLGIKALLSREHETTLASPSASARQAFSKAVVTGVLNPKVALFFLAFLPQFVDAQRGLVFLQFLVLGVTLAVLDTVYESMLASVASTVASGFATNPGLAVWRQRVTGTVLLGLGVRLALTERE